jgi:hypothetical protein
LGIQLPSNKNVKVGLQPLWNLASAFLVSACVLALLGLGIGIIFLPPSPVAEPPSEGSSESRRFCPCGVPPNVLPPALPRDTGWVNGLAAGDAN